MDPVSATRGGLGRLAYFIYSSSPVSPTDSYFQFNYLNIFRDLNTCYKPAIFHYKNKNFSLQVATTVKNICQKTI